MPLLIRRFMLVACLCGALSSAAPPPAKALSLCVLYCTCTISTSAISMTDYNPLNGAVSTGTGTVTTGCKLTLDIGVALTSYTVTLNMGNAATSYATRKMTGPSAATLNYNLYTNSAMTTIWGDGTNGTSYLSSGITVSVLNVVVQDIQSIYAQIPGGQNVPWGSYSDTITATLSF